MTPVPRVDIDVPDESALGPLGRAVAAALPRGGFVAITGDLGAGKTTFVKACAAAAGVDPAEVVSPTFGLIHVHAGRRGPIVHADLYRLADVADLTETGWDDAVAAADMTFLEWPERAAAALPAERLDVSIAIRGPTARTFSFSAHGPAHDAAIATLAAALRPASPSLPGSGSG